MRICKNAPCTVNEQLASYLWQSEASYLKVSILSSKPFQTTSQIIGKVYVVAEQAGCALHTMSVLQVCKADQLKDLDQGQGFSPEVVGKLHCSETGLIM